MHAFPQTTFAPRLCDLLEYGFDLGLQDYPIYDEGDRDRLNQAIVSHFYMREIGYETPALFIMALNRTMAERMPQINEVHAALESLDPWSTAESESASETTNHSEGESADNATSSADARAYNSNAPQVSMVGKDEISYYDTGTNSENSSTSETQATNSSESSGTTKTTAKARQGAAQDLIAAYYEGYNNTDLMVFDALETCFSHVYPDNIAVW